MVSIRLPQDLNRIHLESDIFS